MSFLSNLFGGSTTVQAPTLGPPPTINFAGPTGFNSPGLSGSFSGNSYNLGQSPALSSAIGSLQQTFQGQAAALKNLAGTVAPGFSQFRQAGLADLRNQQRANISNLRDNLAQRRVLGSSFANASISQANADYAQNRSNFIAQSYLQELGASQQLIQQQFTAQASGFKTGLDQLNLESGVAADLSGRATSALASVATAQAQLDQQNAVSQAQMTLSANETNAKLNADSSAGFGKFLGSILGSPSNSIAGQALSGIGSDLSFLATPFTLGL